jgi:hypothetical protein
VDHETTSFQSGGDDQGQVEEAVVSLGVERGTQSKGEVFVRTRCGNFALLLRQSLLGQSQLLHALLKSSLGLALAVCKLSRHPLILFRQSCHLLFQFLFTHCSFAQTKRRASGLKPVNM